MCHLDGLPGPARATTPRAGWTPIVDRRSRATWRRSRTAGVDGLLFCNENDLPYLTRGRAPRWRRRWPRSIGRLRPRASGVPFGVDLLWDRDREPRRRAAPPARRSCARCSPASSTATWASRARPRRRSPATGTRSAPTTSPCSATSPPSSASSVGGRTVAERARRRGVPRRRRAPDQRPGRRASAPTWRDLREAKEAVAACPVLANTGVSHETVERDPRARRRRDRRHQPQGRRQHLEPGRPRARRAHDRAGRRRARGRAGA